jgi:hypothetical protein
MTRGSVKEYAAAIRDRYRSANKLKKGKMLDEFIKVTGYHRKAAIRMLLKVQRQHLGRRGRPSLYKAVFEPLRLVWEASDGLCSKRLQPLVPELVRVLRQHGEQQIDVSQEKLLCQMSAATIDRLLRPCRRLAWGKGKQSISKSRNTISAPATIRHT